MAEYNFWDDRTWDTCDENWCPIANDYCLNGKYHMLPSCNYCKEMIEFMRFLDKDEKSKTWTVNDIAFYVRHSYGSKNMIQLSYTMILDHLY